MSKLWNGRFNGTIDKNADDFNSSISFDKKMYKQDILGSLAHVKMLAKQGIISKDDQDLIIKNLIEIREDIDSGKLKISDDSEDIHSFVEGVLTERIGSVGKKLHTARSRNDQVAVDLKLYVRESANGVINLLYDLIEAVLIKAEEEKSTIMPGYTHLQRAQPITFGFHLLAYAQMFKRDVSRLKDAVCRMNYSPLGSCALAGTTYPTDRSFTATELGFAGACENAMDGVSDRDFCMEILADFSILMSHLSRFSEEIILWSSWEFAFIRLSDEFTTGSSIMPQKKNSDMAELVRGKTGRVYGDLMAMLTIMKGLPLAYNKDMQEDKESVFDAIETVEKCLTVFIPMIKTFKTFRQNMLNAAKKGFINATDLADYLTKKGVPFREAYKLTGQIVNDCIEKGLTLEEVSLEEYKKYNELFEGDLYDEINLLTCVNKRISEGGTSPISVEKQIKSLKTQLADWKK